MKGDREIVLVGREHGHLGQYYEVILDPIEGSKNSTFGLHGGPVARILIRTSVIASADICMPDRTDLFRKHALDAESKAFNAKTDETRRAWLIVARDWTIRADREYLKYHPATKAKLAPEAGADTLESAIRALIPEVRVRLKLLANHYQRELDKLKRVEAPPTAPEWPGN